jgi:hypothetical protein
VTGGMLLLALLGVATVFHEPIVAIFAPPSAGGEAPPPVSSDEHGGPPPARPAP